MTVASTVFAENRATGRDIEAHLAACDSSFTPPLSQRVAIGEYARKLRERAHTFEAWDGGTLSGLVAAYMNAATRSCFVTNVSVLPSASGRGVGSALMGRCIERARSSGMQEVALRVSAVSARAVRLYQRHGLRVTGREGEELAMSLPLEAEQDREQAE